VKLPQCQGGLVSRRGCFSNLHSDAARGARRGRQFNDLQLDSGSSDDFTDGERGHPGGVPATPTAGAGGLTDRGWMDDVFAPHPDEVLPPPRPAP